MIARVKTIAFRRSVAAGILGVLALLTGCAPAGGLLSGGEMLPDNPGIGGSDDGSGPGGTIGITIHATFGWVVEAQVERLSLRDEACGIERFDDTVGRDAGGVVSGAIEIEVWAGCPVLAFVAQGREADGSRHTWIVILRIDPPNVSLHCGPVDHAGGCDPVTALDQGPSGGLGQRYELAVTINSF